MQLIGCIPVSQGVFKEKMGTILSSVLPEKAGVRSEGIE